MKFNRKDRVLLFIWALFLSATVLGQEGGWVDAKLKTKPSPSIPHEARQSGLRGTVRVIVRIDENGSVVSATEASGPDWVCPQVTREDVLALRNAAIVAAKKAKFSPATQDGKPIVTRVMLDIEFGKIISPELGKNKENKTYVALGESASDLDATNKDKPLKAPPKTLSGGVLNGKAASLPTPQYPPAARAVRASGSVPVQVLILEDGTVFSAEPLKGHPFLQAASRESACAAKFMPTLLAGQPVKVSGIITYNYVP